MSAIDDLLVSKSTLSPYSSLPLSVSRTSTHYIVCAELPGIPQNQISVDINEDGVLTIQAERHSKEKTKDEDVEDEIFNERWRITSNKLYRSISFPKNSIDVDGVKVELNNGELIIKVPKKKTQEAKKKIIEIIKGKL